MGDDKMAKTVLNEILQNPSNYNYSKAKKIKESL
jgi:hypothetical protein